MERERMKEDTVRAAKTFCKKHQIPNPNCAECRCVEKEDVEEKLRIYLPALNMEVTSAMFRLFHPDPETRSRWRTRFCKHFKNEY